MKQPTETEKLTALLGGVDMDVTLMDGTTETVKVRQLNIRNLDRYAVHSDDSAKCVELFTGNRPEWVDKLTPESALQILAKGHELNADFLARAATLKVGVREKLIPNYQELVQQALRSALPSSAPASPSTLA